MKMIQLLPTIVVGDAVSNDAIALSGMIGKMGFETGIYAENIDSRLRGRDGIFYAYEMPELEDDDVIIYHASTGDVLNFSLPRKYGRKVLRYHNITPPEFFRGYSRSNMLRTEAGYRGMRFLKNHVDFGLADSDYNRHDLRKMGYRCPIEVCPILIPLEDYAQEPDAKVVNRYAGDGWTNLLFVGRIAPNKKQEDVIRAFEAYQRKYQPKSRLFLVGSARETEKYEAELKRLAADLGLADRVIFSGHVNFREILAYYRLADVFICMSAHEGFCVPLVEAMYFDKPIVARGTSAVPETLGDAGILLESSDPDKAAEAIHRILEDEQLRARLSESRKDRMESFSYETVSKRFQTCMNRFLRE